jgi:hypothetical protein
MAQAVRAPAQQTWDPEFKFQYHQKKRKRRKPPKTKTNNKNSAGVVAEVVEHLPKSQRGEKIMKKYCKQLCVNKLGNVEERESPRQKWLKMTQEEIENLNRPVTSEEMDWPSLLFCLQIHCLRFLSFRSALEPLSGELSTPELPALLFSRLSLYWYSVFSKLLFLNFVFHPLGMASFFFEHLLTYVLFIYFAALAFELRASCWLPQTPPLFALVIFLQNFLLLP